MFGRLAKVTTFTIIAVASFSPSLRAQKFEYATGASRYRVTTAAKAKQAAMGQEQSVDISMGEKLSVTVARASKDTLTMTAVIDSIGSTSEPIIPGPNYAAFKGTKVAAWLSPSGRLFSSKLSPADSTGQIGNVAEEIAHILPHVRVALANGATWTDTNSSKVSQMGLAISRSSISEFTVVGDTTIGSEHAWKISRKSTSTSTGNGELQGTATVMTGTSTGTGLLFLSKAGVYLGGETNEEATAKVTMTAQGMEFIVSTQAKTKIERLN